MVSRILALLVWAAVAASLAYWGLRWVARPAAVPPGTSSVALSGAAPRGDVTKLLSPPAKSTDEPSAPSQQAMLASRLQLVGVVAPRSPGDKGIALLVVDGKPARAFRTGYVVDGDLVLQSVTQQGVQIGPSGGPAAVNLNLPLMPAAATGSLPNAGGMGANSSSNVGHGGPSYGGMPPTAGRRPGGGYAPQGGAATPQRGGGLSDVPIEGAEPPAAGPTSPGSGASLTLEDGPQQAQALTNPAAAAAARGNTRAWHQRRGGASSITAPGEASM